MADLWEDLIGTSLGKLQHGIGGPFSKNVSGDLAARDPTDASYVAMRMALAKIFGNDIQLNSGATESGASWIMTLSRPSAGMTGDVQIIMPPDLAPSVNQALTIASISSGVITLQWATIAAGTDKIVVDTTTLAFGTSSPITMFTAPANAEILVVELVIDTAFNGTPTLSVGVSGTTSKYAPTSAWDLTAAAKTRFKYHPNEPASGSTAALIATYSAGGASAGAAHILTWYCIPS